jgi:hypothetical protein
MVDDGGAEEHEDDQLERKAKEFHLAYGLN